MRCVVFGRSTGWQGLTGIVVLALRVIPNEEGL